MPGQHCSAAGVDSVKLAPPHQSFAGCAPTLCARAAAGRLVPGTTGRAPPDLSVLSRLLLRLRPRSHTLRCTPGRELNHGTFEKKDTFCEQHEPPLRPTGRTRCRRRGRARRLQQLQQHARPDHPLGLGRRCRRRKAQQERPDTRADCDRSSGHGRPGARNTVKTWAFSGLVPGKELRVSAGDTLAATLSNQLPNQTTTSVHWHGIALRNDMDGVPPLTQSAVRAGRNFTYRFTADTPGTYFFHPHVGVQLDRGLYAPLIVEDPRNRCRTTRSGWSSSTTGSTVSPQPPTTSSPN